MAGACSSSRSSLAAALVAWALARSISSPLRQVAKVAEELPDDLDLRADERHGPHEVRAVAVALNSTADRLSGILQRTQRVAADAQPSPADAAHRRAAAARGDRGHLRPGAGEDRGTGGHVRGRSAQPADRAGPRAGAQRCRGGSHRPSGHRGHRAGTGEAAAAMFAETGIELTTTIETDVRVAAPSGVVARIVDELLGNALQYARTRVHVDLQRSDRAVVLAVSDDGPGLPPDEREAVFERFTRGSASVRAAAGWDWRWCASPSSPSAAAPVPRSRDGAASP